jgi:hypothetical protein
MVNGIKSKEFGCIWKTMFIIAMCYPEKFNKDCESHVAKRKHYRSFYGSLQYVIPCKFCRTFMKELILPSIPLDYSGRIPLMFSLYQWKDTVNRKLILQGNDCPPSPPFEEILQKYTELTAVCDPGKGKCI